MKPIAVFSLLLLLGGIAPRLSAQDPSDPGKGPNNPPVAAKLPASAIVGLTITPDGKDEQEVDVSFTGSYLAAVDTDVLKTAPMFDGVEGDIWYMAQWLTVAGTPIPSTLTVYDANYGVKSYERRLLSKAGTPLGTQLEKIAREHSKVSDSLGEIEPDVNHPEAGEQRKQQLLAEGYALTAKVGNLILTNYPGSLEDSLLGTKEGGSVTGAFGYSSGDSQLFPEEHRVPAPFHFIPMSAYEKWASAQLNARKSEPADKRRKHLLFLNRILFDRILVTNYNQRVNGGPQPTTFETNTLGADFLKSFDTAQ